MNTEAVAAAILTQAIMSNHPQIKDNMGDFQDTAGFVASYYRIALKIVRDAENNPAK